MTSNETQQQAESIADALVNEAGGNLANTIYNAEFKGETFTAMRQKAAELLVKLDLIATSLTLSGVIAQSLQSSNKSFKEQIPYDQKGRNSISSKQTGDPNEDPENVATQYLVPEGGSAASKSIHYFITSDGKEKNPDEDFLISPEIASTVTDSYDPAVQRYEHFMERLKGMYTTASDRVDAYDRGEKQAWQDGEAGKETVPFTITKSFLSSPNFRGNLQTSDFEPVAGRLEGIAAKVDYTGETNEQGGQESTSAYSYLNELNERTWMTYEEHEAAKEAEYEAYSGSVKYAQPYITPDGRQVTNNGDLYPNQEF